MAASSESSLATALVCCNGCLLPLSLMHLKMVLKDCLMTW